jgi:tetratricopeptide (TPR) repeat protein
MNRYDAVLLVIEHLPSASARRKVMRQISLLAAVLIVSATAGAPNVAAAIESGSPAAPQTTTQQPPSTAGAKKAHVKKSKKSSATEDFYKGWHQAYALIYDKADYADGIAVLRAMGYDDNADVATLIGYASRKLGRYDDAKVWYDRALAADPNHALTWSYYGMWQAEQGNILKAKDDLEKVKSICGTECRSYTALKAAIDGTVTY